MSDERTIKIEMTITHTDYEGQTREVRQSRVYPLTGDNPLFVHQNVKEVYREFDSAVMTPLLFDPESRVWK